MSVTAEELAAYADGEIMGVDAARVAAAISADPELARQLAAHQALKARLAAHFVPISAEPVPEHLARLLRGEDTRAAAPNIVIDLAGARAARTARRRLPAWAWGGGALAASLVAGLLVMVPGPADRDAGNYAAEQLAAVLDSRLVSTQTATAATRVLLSFRNASGEYCRAYNAPDASGIACRDARGWRIDTRSAAVEGAQGNYRQAGSEVALLAAAQDMAAGPALSAEEEEAARAAGWLN